MSNPHYNKFKKHLESGGLIYLFWRAIKYLVFLIKQQIYGPVDPQNIIIKGRTKIVYSANCLNIFWDNNEITKNPGLNIAINTLGIWTNTTEADWQILEKGEDYFKFKIVFRNLPLSQIWSLKIRNEQEVDWLVDTEIESLLHVNEFRMVCLASPRYKTWFKGYQQGDYPRLDTNWHDLSSDELPKTLIGCRFPTEGSFLPAILLETKDNHFLPLIQNSPLEVNSHIVAFRRIDSEDKRNYAKGVYRTFNGKINLFTDELLLENKIETMRQAYLKSEVENRAGNKTIGRQLKVLLVNLPWQKDGRWGVRAGSRWPHIKDNKEDDYLPFPFFLSYSASLLQKNNIEVFMIDAIAERLPEDKFLDRVFKSDFDYLVAETSIPSFYYDLDLLKKVSRANIPIILCGPNSEMYQPSFLKDNQSINFVLYGEYEFTLLELIQCLENNEDLAKICGLIYSDNGNIIKNLPRKPFDIDLLPWPYRDGLPMYKYLDAPGEMLTPSVQMLASRGCPFKCQFCLWPQVIYQGNHYRARSVKDVVDEMEFLVKEKGFKSVYFDDDTFNVGKERMLSFCRELKERGLDKTQWAIMARPDLMDGEILKNMKEAGLWAIKYGVESATQSLVDSIDKNMNLKKTEKMILSTKKLGIRVHLTFTFGLPGETKESIEKTIKWALKLNPFSLQFSITTPFPGTEYYKILDKQNAIVEKNLSFYDGNHNSVIRLKNLKPQDLEAAKIRAYKIWADHSRKRRGVLGNLKRFFIYWKDKGLGYSITKTINFFKYIISGSKEYLNY